MNTSGTEVGCRGRAGRQAALQAAAGLTPHAAAAAAVERPNCRLVCCAAARAPDFTAAHQQRQLPGSDCTSAVTALLAGDAISSTLQACGAAAGVQQ